MENVENMKMKLQDCCEAIVDCPHTTAPDEGEGYPLVRTPNIGKGRLIYNGMHRVSECVYKQRNKRMTPLPGDLIFAREAPAGNVAILQPGEFVCLGQRTVLLRVDKKVADSSFLAYYLLSPIVRHNLVELANGATVSHINIPDLKKLEISLPPLPTQRRIAGVLGALDDKIELNRKMNENLEAQAQALFKSWFVDFAPWGGKMPAGWKMGKLGEIAEYSSGRLSVDNVKCEYYSTDGMMADRQGATASALPTTGNVVDVNAGDTLVSNIRPYFKKIFHATAKCTCSTDVLCFRPISPSWEFFLYRALWSDDFFVYAMAGAKGTKMPRGDKSQIMAYELPIPREESLRAFNKAVKPMCQLVAANIEEYRKLAELRDALLPKLMSGELEVA